MNDESMVAQAAVPYQAAAEALQTIAGKNHYAGGNALLGAEAEAGPEIDPAAIAQQRPILLAIKPQIQQRQSGLPQLKILNNSVKKEIYH